MTTDKDALNRLLQLALTTCEDKHFCFPEKDAPKARYELRQLAESIRNALQTQAELPSKYNPETHAIIDKEWLNTLFQSLFKIEDICAKALARAEGKE